MEDDSSVRLAAERLASCKRVVVLTGAGVSAESGIPTFRGRDGLWKGLNPLELATPEAFQRDPGKVWRWYLWRYERVIEAEPNPAHRALAEMEGLFRNFVLITQNVDDLHRRAGSQRVLELHGNITRARCTRNPSHRFPLAEALGEDLPKCPRCGALARPDVVWFGEALPYDVLRRAISAAERAQAFLAVGTSAVVEPAASLPIIAKEQGAFLVEINPETTPISGIADIRLEAPAGRVLPRILACLKDLRAS